MADIVEIQIALLADWRTRRVTCMPDDTLTVIIKDTTDYLHARLIDPDTLEWARYRRDGLKLDTSRRFTFRTGSQRELLDCVQTMLERTPSGDA